MDSVVGNNNEKQHRDLKQTFKSQYHSVQQVNFRENQLKIIIWGEEEGDMLATIIFTVGSETRAQSFSLMTDSSSQISAELRGLLTDTRRRLRSVNQ